MNRQLHLFRGHRKIFSIKLIIGWVIFSVLAQVAMWLLFQACAYGEIRDVNAPMFGSLVVDTSGLQPFWRSKVLLITIGFGMAIYGFVRGTNFQPIGEYRKWLLQSPWTPEMPLPMGPNSLVWQDSIAILVLGSPLLLQPLSFLVAVGIFFSAYILTQLPALHDSDQAHLIWIGATVVVSNLIILQPDLPVTVTLTVATCFGLVCLGQRRFIRTLREIDAKRNGTPNIGTESSSPYGFAIGPPDKETWTPRTGWIGIVVVICWASYCSVTAFQMHLPGIGTELRQIITLLSWITGISLSVAHLSMRVRGGYRPPISILKRIQTGRWIVPDYDTVLIGPAILIVSGLGLPLLFAWVGAPVNVSLAGTIACLAIMFPFLPPDVKQWRLTASFQLSNRYEGVQLKSDRRVGMNAEQAPNLK